MGNERLGLTAELAALIRAENKADRYSPYFVTSRAKRIYSIVSWVFPKGTLKRIFDKRTKLSNEIHRIVEQYKPEQVIELASGSSTFGLEYSRKHPRVVYVETDMGSVIKKKIIILKQILRDEKLRVNPYHVLVPLDVLSKNMYKALRKHIKKGKRTLVIAEGLTSYFDDKQYEILIDNIGELLVMVGEGSYLSHETLGEKMTSGIDGKILRGIVSALTRSRLHQHFRSQKELISYFVQKGFKETKHIGGSSGSYVFVMQK